MPGRRFRWSMLALVALVPFLARGARAQLVDEVLLLAVETPGGWFFEVEVEGSLDLMSADLTLPAGGETIAVLCEVFGEGVGCELEDPEGMEGFDTLEDLHAMWPTGTYVLTVGDGMDTFTADLPFDPTVPDGTIAITSPIDGETDVGAAPTIGYEHTCSEICTHVLVDIETLESASGELLDLEFETTTLTSPNEVSLAEFERDDGGMVSELPNGTYVVDAAVTTESSSELAFEGDPTATFELVTGGEVTSPGVTFTVPEPGSWAAGAVALGVLGLLRRRHAPARDARRDVATAAGPPTR